MSDLKKKVEDFLEFQNSKRRRVVLITSGGTSVPLEKNMVRFIDNFSLGTRGSASAEYFLDDELMGKNGDSTKYAVIFMHRRHSLQPFARHFQVMHLVPESMRVVGGSLSGESGSWLDRFVIKSPDPVSNGAKDAPKSEICLSSNCPEHDRLLYWLPKLEQVRKENRLLLIEFTHVNEYLDQLKWVSEMMGHIVQERAMWYLACAVSDFYIPEDKLNEHKIQSSCETLTLQMQPVPKILKPLVSEWASRGFIISFKLETDPEMLNKKALRALQRYGHQLVIGNILKTRKDRVTLYLKPFGQMLKNSGAKSSLNSKFEINEENLVIRDILLDSTEESNGLELHEIEEKIVPEMIRLHSEWVDVKHST